MGVKLSAALGGSVELVPTNTASNYTATMPAKTGTVGMDGPAFSATQGTGVTVSSGVNTLCTLSTENFDTNSRFNNTGSTVGGIPAYAFLPDVAGYYQVNLSVSGNGSTTTGRIFAWIAKNGTATYGASTAPQGNANTGVACISTVIYMNGTTDYLQAYGNVEGTGTLTLNVSAANFFSASLVRGA